LPLTPAHAAAIVPLSRWKSYFWLSPLAVGSMAPDFAYFVFPPPALRHIGHTWLGLVLFCVPVGLAVLYAFHQFIKRPLVLLMPQLVRGKLLPYCGPFPLLPLQRLAWLGTLIYLGAVSHVLWDGITHDDGWAVRDCPQMRAVLFIAFGHRVVVFGLLQYVSSVLGLGLLAWWSWQWYRKAPSVPERAEPPLFRQVRPLVGLGMILVAVVVGLTCGLLYACRFRDSFPIMEFCRATFITGADAFGLTLLAFSLIVNLREWRRGSRDRVIRRSAAGSRGDNNPRPKKLRRHDWLFLLQAQRKQP
jgi:hypothetical protein